jgi:hypothetical protein
MRFMRGDVRDHVASQKNDHGASYRCHEASQPWSRLKINFREIFDGVRFSTFSTLSTQLGLCQLRGADRTTVVLKLLLHTLPDTRNQRSPRSCSAFEPIVRKHRFRAADLESALEVASHAADVLVSDRSDRKQVLVADLLSRVVVAKTGLKISVKLTRLRALLSNNSEPHQSTARELDIVLEAEFVAANRDRTNKLLIEKPNGFRSGPDPAVVKAVARAQSWFEQLVSGKTHSMAQIAARENVTDNYVSNLIHLAWLPPYQIDLILEGDSEATKLAKNSMLTRNVDIIWREPPARAWA